MDLTDRIDLMAALGDYLSSNDEGRQVAMQQAQARNGWFTPEFIELALKNICTEYLQKDKLQAWAEHYHIDDNIQPKLVGIVMAGNLPLVGFHDFLSVFISGHHQMVKLSEKDKILFKFIHAWLTRQNPEIARYATIAERLSGCDAYIATGSNNTGRYFEQYFGRFPHIIRKNKTSVAVLSGSETDEELSALSHDIHAYYGFGCRNVTKLFVPQGYNFEKLINAFNNYKHLEDNHKYKNNYDYQLSLVILNHQYYMTNGTTLLTENEAIFSPPAHIYFSYYQDKEALKNQLAGNPDIQCIVGTGFMPFGKAQQPSITDYADGVDTMQFLLTL